MFKLIPELISELILDRIDREIHSLKHLQLKFGLSSEYLEFFNKISVRILLDVLFRVFRFSKASFYALTSSFITFLACVAGVRKGRGRGRELGRETTREGGGRRGTPARKPLFSPSRLLIRK